MNEITSLKEQIAGFLGDSGEFTGAKIMTAYPAAERDYPLASPVVAVGVDAVEVTPAGLGEYWGDTATDSLQGSGASVTLRFDLYAPTDRGGDGPHALYEALCGCLMLRETPFGCHRLRCGEIGYDKAAAAYRLPAFLTLRGALVRRETGAAIERFHLTRVDEKE